MPACAPSAPASRASTSCRWVFWPPGVAKNTGNTGSARAWAAPTCPVSTAANSPDHLSTGKCKHAR
eukprot:13140452-Alexandrium_andersonii.AAC.1